MGEPATGPTDTGLDLVQHQQRTVRGGDLPSSLQVALWGDYHTVLALNGLEKHRGSVPVDR